MKTAFGVMLLVLLFAGFGIGDEPVPLFIGSTEISGSESQRERLWEVESKYGNQIALIEKAIATGKRQLKILQSESETESLKILDPTQRQMLDAARLEESIYKLKERLRLDKLYLEEVGSILPIIGTATTVELYEGLKRTGMKEFVMPEPGEQTFQFLSYTFYKTKLTIQTRDALMLQEICSNHRSFGGYLGGKFCGGFHPDALIRFNGPEGQVDVLVCFGCAEALVRVGEKEVMLEIESPGYYRLRDDMLPLLPRHRKSLKAE